MNGELAPGEIARIETVICSAHSEVIRGAGSDLALLIGWVRAHHDCDLTVVLADDRLTPLDIAAQLANYDG
jgi:hypothetical protein